MIKQRLLSSAVIISLLAGVLYLDMREPLMKVGGLWLMPLLLGLALLATVHRPSSAVHAYLNTKHRPTDL
jgi:hypothetical protein